MVKIHAFNQDLLARKLTFFLFLEENICFLLVLSENETSWTWHFHNPGFIILHMVIILLNQYA